MNVSICDCISSWAFVAGTETHIIRSHSLMSATHIHTTDLLIISRNLEVVFGIIGRCTYT